MIAKIHFASNDPPAWFLSHPVPKEEDSSLESRQDEIESGAGPVPVQLLMAAADGGYSPFNPTSKTVTHVHTDKIELLARVKALLEEGLSRDGMPGDSRPIAECKENVAIYPLEGGYVVRHKRPLRKGTTPGEGWKKDGGGGDVPGWAVPLIEAYRDQLGLKGRVSILGFSTIPEVVAYVSQAIRESEQGE
jgi:hypothetical protein